jgi:hypothetical protein
MLLQSVSGVITLAPGRYWTDVSLQVSDSADNVTWSDWQQVPSTFTTQRYVRYRVDLPDENVPWPLGLKSLWVQLDMPSSVQNGTLNVPSSGAAVTYNPAYRLQVTPVVSVQGSTAATAVVTAESLTGFTVQAFNSAGSPVAATVTWHAQGV